MKILIVSQRFYPSNGGSQKHVHQIAKELVKRGHDVTVATTASLTNIDVMGLSTMNGVIFKSAYPDLPDKEVVDGIKIRRFNPMIQILTYMITPGLFLYLLRNSRKYDIIHTHCYMYAEPDMVAFVTALHGPGFVLTAHDIIPPYGGIYRPFKWLYDVTIGNFTLSRAKRVIALTEENRKQYKELGVAEEKIVLIPNGVDYKKFSNLQRTDRTGNPKDNRTVLCVARLVKYKGIQHIIKSIPRIIADYPNTKFVFVGEDNGYKQELENITKSLDVAGYCEFAGKVSDEELLCHYANADVFVLPSTGEGFGLTALESMILGTPAILADHGGLKYVLKDIGGYPLDMTDEVPFQIAEKVKYIFSNPSNVKEELKKQQQIIQENYTWEKVVEKTERTYEATLR